MRENPKKRNVVFEGDSDFSMFMEPVFKGSSTALHTHICGFVHLKRNLSSQISKLRKRIKECLSNSKALSTEALLLQVY